MRMNKIALWLLIAVLLSGMILGFSLVSDAKKLGGWDNMVFGIGSQYDVNEVKDIDLNNAKRIEIRTSSSDTSVFTSGSEKVKASLTGKVRTTDPGAVPTLEIEQSGDTIYIRELRTSQKNGSFVTWSFSTNNLKLDISIPGSFHGEISHNGSSGGFTTSNLNLNRLALDLSSGDIDLTNITLDEDLNVSSSSGNLVIKGLKAKTALLKSTSGNKTFEGITLAGILQITTSSGNNKLADITCQQIVMDSTSGEIRAERIKTDTFQAKSSSGNIVTTGLDGGARLKATSGNIEVTASNARGEYHLSASSGNIKLALPANTGFELDSQVSSGNIRCDFTLDNQNKGEKYLKGTVGNGEIPLRVDTTSGNITISKR